MAYYRVNIGTGTAWLDSYILETEEPTTDYGALVDALIDYLRENDPEQLLDPDTYMFDDFGNIFFIDDPDSIIYEDEFVCGGNYDDVLMHYGNFNIEEIDESEVDYDTPIIQVDEW